MCDSTFNYTKNIEEKSGDGSSRLRQNGVSTIPAYLHLIKERVKAILNKRKFWKYGSPDDRRRFFPEKTDEDENQNFSGKPYKVTMYMSSYIKKSSCNCELAAKGSIPGCQIITPQWGQMELPILQKHMRGCGATTAECSHITEGSTPLVPGPAGHYSSE